MAGRLKNMFVFFYEEGDILAERILGGLEELEDQLANLGIDFVKVSILNFLFFKQPFHVKSKVAKNINF